MSAENKIVYDGALAGILSGFAIKAAFGAGQSSLPVTIYNTFCQAVQNVQPAFNCGIFIIVLAIIAVLLTILTFLEALNKTDNRKHAIMLYCISYFLGVLIIILFV